MDINYSSAMSALKPGTFVPDIGTEAPPSATPIPDGSAEQVTSFKDTLQNFLGGINDKLQTADQMSQDLATGRTNDVTKVVTSVEEANLSMEFAMALRTKLINAYQTISQMQV